MKTFKFLAIFILALTMTNCEEYDPSIAIQDVPLSVGFFRETDTYSIDPANPVYKLAVTSTQVSNVDRVINVTFNEAATTSNLSNQYTPGDFSFGGGTSGTVTIPAGQYVGYGDITFDFDNVTPGSDRYLIFDLEIPEGTVRNVTKDQITLTYKPLCSLNELVIDVTFDNFSEEISWELYDAEGNVEISSDGAFAAGLTNSSITACVEDGDYIFVINDSYGDGLGTTGSYKITDASGNIIVSGDGAFTTFRIHEFTVGN